MTDTNQPPPPRTLSSSQYLRMDPFLPTVLEPRIAFTPMSELGSEDPQDQMKGAFVVFTPSRTGGSRALQMKLAQRSTCLKITVVHLEASTPCADSSPNFTRIHRTPDENQTAEQAGFRPASTHRLLQVPATATEIHRVQKPLWVAAIDFKKAFKFSRKRYDKH